MGQLKRHIPPATLKQGPPMDKFSGRLKGGHVMARLRQIRGKPVHEPFCWQTLGQEPKASNPGLHRIEHVDPELVEHGPDRLPYNGDSRAEHD